MTTVSVTTGSVVIKTATAIKTAIVMTASVIILLVMAVSVIDHGHAYIISQSLIRMDPIRHLQQHDARMTTHTHTHTHM
jgi:hypothetical protein